MRLIKGHFQALTEIATLLVRHRDLTWEMARRELSDRYAGQAFGLVWAVGHPLFMIALYVFVFAFVFKMKIGGTADMPLDYTAYLLSGLIAWMGFQESLLKSCTAISGNAPLVKQVVFPLEVLPVKVVLAALFPQVVSLTTLVLYVLLSNGRIPTTYLLLPALVILQIMAMAGLAFILSAVGAYFRDIKDFIQLFSAAGIYLMPVFYLPNWVPSLFEPLLYANPFSYVVWCYQDALYFGRFAHPWAWLVNAVLSVGVFALGYRIFRKVKPLFGNIL